MTIKNNRPGDAAGLRRQAEAKWSGCKKKAASLPAAEPDSRRLVHELEVHQIELEMQNEELLQTRARAEALLAQYTDLYEFAPVGYFSLACDGAIHQVNLAGANLMGVECGALINRRFGVFVSVESRTIFSAFLEKIFSKSASKETCEVALRKNGSAPCWMHIEAASSNDGGECKIAVIDITERKEEEAHSRRLATVVRDSNDAITIQDFGGRILAWNRGAELMYGYSEEDALHMSIWQITPAKKAAEKKEFIRRLKEGEAITSFETQRETKDGRILDVWMTVTKLVDDTGKPVGIASTERDITGRKKKEEEASRMVTVVRDSNDAITIQDFEGRVLAWNRGAELMYGYSEQEALQKNIWLLTPPDREEEQKDFTRRLIAGEKITSLETQRVTKDGRIIDIWMTVTKLVDDTGKSIGIASTERDITGRKRKEEEFKSAKSLLDTVIDSSPFAMWISDREGMLIRTNRSLRETLNLTDEQLIGKYNVLKDANLEMQGVMPMVRAVFEMHTPARFIIPWKASNAGDVDFKGGRDLYIDVSIFPILDKNRELTNAVCQWVNITDRKLAEEALRKSEELFHSTLDNMMEGCQIIGADWRYLYVNEVVAKQGRRPAKEFVGRTMMECYPGIKTTPMFELLAQCMKDRLPRQMENEFVYENGEKAWFQLAVQPVPEGVFVLSLGITERKRAEDELKKHRYHLEELVKERTAELKKSEEKFRTLADFTYDWEYWLDPERRMLYISPSCERITGFSPDSFYKEPQFINTIIHPDDRQSFENHVGLYHVGNKHSESDEREFRIVDRNGGTKWIAHVCAPITGEGGAYLGRRVSNRDITKRKHAEEELRRQSVELEATNRELESFAYSVSHDLRAPLRTIDGFSQIIIDDYSGKLDEQGKNYLLRVKSATQRMGQLIDDMLKLSRITRQELKREETDLSMMVRKISAELSHNQPERQVEFVIKPGCAEDCDRQLIGIALENLIGNSWKYSSRHTSARIEFGATEKDGKTVYFVRDDGAGFDPAYADKLFSPFQRLHAASEFEGNGIGLATIQRIVRKHGGSVWAEGQVEKGATFYFTLT
jgi:PAS domain S-box-containing protein